MPKDLLESELFGHERGAFTGAQQQRRGRFEQAEGGTLFLDEIGDMPPELQTRLLRVLSDGSFYRVGGHQQMKVNVRVIAATHQNLEQRVREGTFREDLYHRLNVIRLRLPSLRERARGHPAAREAFPRAERARARRGAQAPVRRRAEVTSSRHDFPGNVRQLENLCHWLTVMAPGRWSKPRPAGGAARAAGRARPPTGSLRWSARPSGASRAATPASWMRWAASSSAPSSSRRWPAPAAGASRPPPCSGMGRNTITRKIQELGIEDEPDAGSR